MIPLTDQSLDPWRESPVALDDPVRVEGAVLGVHLPLEHVGAEDGRVVRVGVLLPLALGHALPAVVEHVLARPDLHLEIAVWGGGTTIGEE